MIVITFIVFSHLKNESVKPASNPSNCTVLLGNFKTMIEIKRVRKYFLRLFEPDATFWFARNRLLL